MSIMPDQEGILLNLIKGTLVGGITTAGAYGLTRAVNNMLESATEKDEDEDELGEVTPKELKFRIKQSASLSDKFVYGMGLVGGGVLGAKLVNSGIDAYRKEKIKKLLNEYVSELEKKSEINAFLDGYLDKAAQDASISDTIGTLASLIPISYGALSGLGLLAGYYGMKNVYKDVLEPKDYVKVPTLVYTLEKLKKKSELNNNYYSNNNHLNKNASLNKEAFGILAGAGLAAGIGYLGYEAFNWGKNKLENYAQDQAETIGKNLLNKYTPHIMAGTLGLGTLFSLPSMLANSGNNNAGNAGNASNNNIIEPPKYKKFESYKGIT